MGITAGLFLGAIGDIFLLPRGAGVPFLIGLISFLVGHICYIAAFFAVPYELTWLIAALCVNTVRSFLIWKKMDGAAKTSKMRSPAVVAYIFVITVMVTVAAANVGAAFEAASSPVALFTEYPATIFRFLGAELFYFSDICVARERFVTSSPVNKYFGLPLYYGAQVILAYWI